MNSPIVECKYGRIKGREENGVYIWRGIPYASPPVGSLRYRPPLPPSSWSGVREAFQFAPSCPQPPNAFSTILGEDNKLNMSEDCLYLNIWSHGVSGKPRPVMVYIHGGGFWFDSSSNSFYEGSSFASEGDIVFVSINYRLGPFGFLHMNQIGNEAYSAAGNCGLLDQVEALKWIKDNISAFGGDPEQITIMGESAGAMSVALLMAMPAAKGLFQKAILQSYPGDIIKTSEEATVLATKMLELIKAGNVSMLETVSVEALLNAFTSLRSSSQLTPAVLQPCIDGRTLPLNPIQAIQSGYSNNIPVLIGTTKDEFNLHVAVNPNLDVASYEQIRLFTENNLPLWSAVSGCYLENCKTDHQITNAMLSAITDFRFMIPSIQFAEAQANHEAPVWMYRFDWETPSFDSKLGACHFLDVPFVFNRLEHPAAVTLTGKSSSRQHLASQMHHAWIAFARNGDPNSSASPIHWPRYDLEKRSTMIFNIESHIELDPNYDKRLAWEGAYRKKSSHYSRLPDIS